MTESNQCQRCGNLLPQATELGGRCPVCMLEWGLESGAESASDAAGDPEPTAASEGLGAHSGVIGRYRVLRLIGEGGMGAVYEAEQDQPRRTVALKVIKPGLATSELLRRFEQESQALGRLQHSGIAQIYEAGTVDTGFGPQPYFAMEFIRGSSPRDHAETLHLKTNDRLKIMVKICDAVHHAHQRGLIHRDLKPANILVDETSQPKILDFGVARVTDSDSKATLQTDMGQLVGTLAYMSPEQVLADPFDLDTRSDVYALGVILYELLTGKLPYTISKKIHETIQTIREEDPAPLSTVSRMYRGDIETIVAKALEKDRTRRYASAAELAADIQRYLSDEPIVARPPSTSYQLRKFARRHKALVAAIVSVFVVLSMGVAASTWMALKVLQAERVALAERDSALQAKMEAQAESDRANSNEKAANVERERAAAAEQQAWLERNNALNQKKFKEAEEAVATAVLNFFGNDLLRMADPLRQSQLSPPNPDITVKQLLDQKARNIGNRFDGLPLVEAAIRELIAETYYGIGDFPAVAEQLERSVELRRRALGSGDPKTLFWTVRLAGVYGQLRLPQSGEPLLKRVLEDARRGPGDDNPATRSALSNLVSLHIVQYGTETGRRFTEFEAFLKDFIAYDRRTLGDNNPTTQVAITELVNLYRYHRPPRFSDAEAFLKQLFGDQKRRLGVHEPATQFTISQLAALYTSQAPPKYAEAESLIKEGIDSARRQHGNDDLAVRNFSYDLANLYFKQNKYADAEAVLGPLVSDTAVKRLTGRRGAEHLWMLDSMDLLLRVYAKLGKKQQADILAKTIMAVVGPPPSDPPAGSGEPAPDVDLIRTGTIALRFLGQGRNAEAEVLIKTTLEGYRRTLRTDPNPSLISRSLITTARAELEGTAHAEKFIKQILEIQRSELGDQHLSTSQTLESLAVWYNNHQRYPEAIDALQDAIAIQRALLGPANTNTMTRMSELAWVYASDFNFLRMQGRSQEARLSLEKGEQYYRQYLAAQLKTPGAEASQQTRLIMVSLASICAVMEKYAEAETLYNRVLALQERAANSQLAPKLSAIASVGWLQFRQKNYTQATMNLQTALDGFEKARLESWERYNTESMLGATLVAQGKYAEGEKHLIQGFEQMLRRTPPTATMYSPLLFLAEEEPGERILKLYKDWGKPDKVVEWQQKLRGARNFRQLSVFKIAPALPN